MNQLHATSVRLIDIRAAIDRFGCKRGKWYESIQHGLMTPPIKLGPRFARWPEHEVDAIVRARISGADDASVRELVGELLMHRKG